MSTPGAANAPGNPAPPTGQIELRIVVTSTRPHRLGPVVADWVRNHAPTERFAVEVLDLAELNLPPVSYTHLDVYKRQALLRGELTEGEIQTVVAALGLRAGHSVGDPIPDEDIRRIVRTWVRCV